MSLLTHLIAFVSAPRRNTDSSEVVLPPHPATARRRRGVTASLLAVTAACGWLSGGRSVQAAPPVPGDTPEAQPRQQKTPTFVPATPTGSQPVTAPPIEQQSPLNPFPRGGGDNQNRSRGSSDVYWGQADANVPWSIAPLSRVPNGSANQLGIGSGIQLMNLDGWQYPRVSQDGVFSNTGTSFVYALGTGRQGTADPNTGQPYWQGPVAADTATTSSNVKSPGFNPNQYYRAPTVPRPVSPANQISSAQRFVWSFELANQIAGAANAQRRYRVYIHFPTPPDPSAGVEDRVDDARYTMYYYVLRTGTDPTVLTNYIAHQQTYVVSQVGGGDSVLLNADGSEAFFPLFTSATNFAGLPAQPAAAGTAALYGAAAAPIHQGLSVDNTTNDTDTNTYYVLADQVQLEPGLDRVLGTPTVTPPHGGTKLSEFEIAQRAAVTAGTAIVPPVDGVMKNQRRPYLPSLTEKGLAIDRNAPSATLVSPYSDAVNRPVDTGLVGTGVARPGFVAQAAANVGEVPTFINDPRDPLYDRLDTRFNAAYDTPNYVLQTWNPSTLFEGPEAIIDPRYQHNPNLPVPAANEDRISVLNNPAYNPDIPYGHQVGPGIPDRPRVNIGNPATADPTDPTLALGRAYRTSTGAIDTNQNRLARSADANNYQAYGRRRDLNGTIITLSGLYTKLFSNVQVIIGRTEYALDPEAGVADEDKTGTKTIQLGAVYSYDWLTGSPLWRFPDRTYLPEGTVNPNGSAVIGYTGGPAIAGLRNARLGGAAAVDPITKFPVFEVPGIVYADRDGDGIISDDEVFIGVDGAFDRTNKPLIGVPLNRTDLQGGIFASITLAPRVMVQGEVKIPVYTEYDTTTNSGLPYRAVSGVANAPLGRYATQPNTNTNSGGYDPVPVGMAFVAAANGVLYGIDSYGNNDTRYEEYRDATTGIFDTFRQGIYRPGTTNVLWTFSATQHSQTRGLTDPSTGRPLEDTTQAYYQRLQKEVPATASFGASAPVLAFEKDEKTLLERDPDPTVAAEANLVNRNKAELRLFVGNTNGVTYALDARALAGADAGVGGLPATLHTLPIRKGVQPDAYTGLANSYTGGDKRYDTYRADLKWWFRARDAINWSPAVSVMQQDSGQGTAGTVPSEKGVYVTSNEGRVYCFDWSGPVKRFPVQHVNYLTWDGTTTAAINLNDDWFFHTSQPANTPFSDRTDGNVRPRWTFPNLYRDIGVNAAPQPSTVAADRAQSNGTLSGDAAGVLLAEPEALGSITTAPMLMDFYWKDPSAANSPELRSYVVVTANDPAASGDLPTESRVYLLDQIGDRVNILSNPRLLSGATGALNRASAQPRDRFSPKVLLSKATDPTIPTGMTWTYRYQYDTFPAADTAQTINEVDIRNSGTSTLAQTTATALQRQVSLRGDTINSYTAQPGRRMVPTVFVGGAGEVYALDIDQETGLFMRWRPTVDEMRRVIPINPTTFLTSTTDPEAPNKTDYPDVESDVDRLPVADPIFTGTNGSASILGYPRSDLYLRRVLARRVGLLGDSGLVTGLTVSGGPLQNRNNRNRENLTTTQPPPYPAGVTGTVPPPAAPTANDATVPQGVVQGAGNSVIAAAIPTNDVPNLKPFILDPTNPTNFDANGLINNLIALGHVTHFVNQDIDDAISTKRGAIYSIPRVGDATIDRDADNEPQGFVQDTAFQYPVLFLTTVNSNLQSISTNIEGEDYLNNNEFGDAATRNEGITSEPLGWGFSAPGNTLRYNTTYHVHLFSQFGPGGPAGIAVMSNEYFPALDPRNDYDGFGYTFGPREPYNANSITPTPTNYPAYPGSSYGAGNATLTPDNGTNNPQATPHPQFRPRSSGFGVLGATNGVPSDIHTGQSGFPLDPNGLFFDKRWANAAGASAQDPNTVITTQGGTGVEAQMANGDYHVRIVRTPSYSGIGEAVDPITIPDKTDNDQLPSGIQFNANNTITPPTNPTGKINVNGTLVGADDPTGDDINPAAQNVTWIFAGSDAGVLYAFTPAMFGQDTGFGGGINNDGPTGPLTQDQTTTTAQVAIFTQDEFNRLLGAPGNGPDLTKTIIANGGRNLFEWGETAYIVAYDVFVSADTAATLTTPFGRIRQRNQPFNADVNAIQVQISITDPANGGTTTGGQTVRLHRSGGAVVTYPYGGTLAGGATNVRTGYALYPFRLTGPSPTNPLTPGARLQITATVTGGNLQVAGRAVNQVGFENGSGGDLAQQLTNNAGARMAIANPLAVQGFLTNTQPDAVTGTTAALNVANTGGSDILNAVGPFFSSSTQYTGDAGDNLTTNAKTRLLPGRFSQGDGTDDPDKPDYVYYQALLNGNRLQRVDTRPVILRGGAGGNFPNPNYGNPIRVQSGGDEPQFYFPVATSPGYVNHGSSGTTALGGNKQLFRLINRSLSRRIASVRALPDDKPGDLLFRAWPGAIMNGDAVEQAVAGTSDNQRLNPAGMHPLGVINPLPWEKDGLPAEAKPWNTAAAVNNSLDYPDINARQAKAVRVRAAGGDLTAQGVGLDSTILEQTTGTGFSRLNSQISNFRTSGALTNPYASVGGLGTSVELSIPKYQPANLVTAHTLTSTYQAPLVTPSNTANRDLSGTGIELTRTQTQGPLQLPRGALNRLLYPYNPDGRSQNTSKQGLSPFGYTSRVTVFVDYDGTNRLNQTVSTAQTSGVNPGQPTVTSSNYSGKAYREFEVWTGVPVDESLKISESVLDMGAESHGFGIQNGQLGYERGTGPLAAIYNYGFLPSPLYDLTTFNTATAPYTNYSKPFTVQNTGNVNLYNLRASQKFENYTLSQGSGGSYSYLALRSDQVDPYFGILSAGGDPNLPNNYTPQVITSLDRLYDAAWDTYIQTNSVLGPAITAPDATGYSPYQRFYQPYGGLHTGHKARVGANAPAVVSIPDVPGAVNVRALNIDPTTQAVVTTDTNALLNDVLNGNLVRPQVAVSVPIGTPIGTYQSSNSPFNIFENHDTNTQYQATPGVPNGSKSIKPVITPAGPLYGGRNDSHPGSTAVAGSGPSTNNDFNPTDPADPRHVPTGPRQIQTAGANTGQDVWRVRRFVPDATAPGGYRVEYQPATSPSLRLKVTVTESAITGQAPDRALDTNRTSYGPQAASVITGTLPGIDPVPLYTNDATISRLRPSAALSPAGWRDANGNLHLYFSRNDNSLPGAPFRLFTSGLAWNANVGVFSAAKFGRPLNTQNVLDMVNAYGTGTTTGNEGQWFTDPTLLFDAANYTAVANSGITMGSAATSPFVLTHYNRADTGTIDQQTRLDAATLYFLVTTPNPGGTPYNQVYFSSLDPTTGGVSAPQPFLANADPTVARYSPRVVFSDNTNFAYLFFFGGAPGKYTLFYSTRRATNGTPNGTAPDSSVRNREIQVNTPVAITSASDPAPVVRQIYLTDPPTGTATLTDVIDLYYTGVSRATQTPDIYLTRYRINGSNIAPISLPRILRERLSSNGRDAVFSTKHMAWFRTLGTTYLSRLPQIYIQQANGTTFVAGTPAAWRYDNATGVLYQTFTDTANNAATLTYVYADASAGTVKFRGPLSPKLGEAVLADYEPQTYRVTFGGGANLSPYTFTDDRFIPATLDSVYATAPTDTVVKRTDRMQLGRQWLFWQRGASGSRPATLFYKARRVGIDLKDASLQTPLGANDSIALSAKDATTLNQIPVVSGVSVGGTPITAYDVDYVHGRVYFAPQYEGQPVVVTYSPTSNPSGSITILNTDGTQPVARYLDELTTGAAEDAGVEAPLVTRVNESQPYAFLDTFNPFGAISRTDPAPYTSARGSIPRFNPADPSLTPGRVWMFWSSPQARKGSIVGPSATATAPDTFFPTAYNLYWATIAPNFETPSYAPNTKTP